ncbi:hypothetical protein [Solibacillus sp. CAU 1738]|uniref:hypothetical protein n=1 Tax=Solibacillus sp. CAU 1738 TaxID=3140363 RepID=UPI003260BF67
MKKLFLACSVLLLASCTEKEKQSVESETKIETSTEEQQAEQKGQQEKSSIVPSRLYSEQLSKVMGELVNKFGFLPNGHTFYDNPHAVGLVYAELFDANADGQEELYVLIKSSSDINDEHRRYAGYMQEIWQANPDGDEAKVLRSNFIKEDPAIIGQTNAVMKSGLDEYEFKIDLQTAGEKIIEVMDQLSVPMNSYITKPSTIEKDIEVQIDNVIQDLRKFGFVDTRERNRYENLAAALILNNLVEPDAPPYSYFIGYKVESINVELEKRFNITLTANDIHMPEPDEDKPYGFFTYKDGVIYIPPSDHYSNEVFRTLEHVVKVSDDVYYARINEIHFDSMTYMDVLGDWNIDLSQYKDTEFNNWPEEAKPYLTQVLPVYAVVKFIDGDAKLLYQGFENLMDEELESY